MLSVQNLRKSYDDLNVISGLNLEVESGEIVALMGPSGCGKTTLLNLISGIERPDGGNISFKGNKISYMFQDARLLPWKTVADNVLLVRDRKNVSEMRSWLQAVGLSQFEHYYPDQLSGGMARRCALARAFYYGGDFFLMDEPFSGLDYGIRMEMTQVLLDIWKREKPGILFVTHEVDEAVTIATRIVLIGEHPAHDLWTVVLPGEEGRDAASPELAEYRHKIIKEILGLQGKS